MSLIAKSSESSGAGFTPVPAGMHLARCYRIIDLGTQKSVWMGTEKLSHKILIQFEIHSEDADGMPLVTAKGDPLSISKRYTMSMNEQSRLSIDLTSWRGVAFTAEERKGFDVRNVLGKWAMVNVTESIGGDNKTYTNIDSITPVPAAMKKMGLPEPVNEAKAFSISEPDMELFDSLSDKLKQTITASPEWQARNGKKAAKAEEDFNDDIPF